MPDDGQQMKIDTVYKNFMGVGGPKDFGLTRRMVQIIVLCLVREGKIKEVSTCAPSFTNTSTEQAST